MHKKSTPFGVLKPCIYQSCTMVGVWFENGRNFSKMSLDKTFIEEVLSQG